MPGMVHLICSSPVLGDGLASVLTDGGWAVTDDDPSSADDVETDVAVVLVRTSAGVAEIRDACASTPDRPVVALTDRPDVDYVTEALRAGATSVVSWDREAAVLLSTLELAVQGVASIESPTLGQLVEMSASPSTVTDTERSWLDHLSRGITIAELAPLAGYSERSLYRQLNSLYHRLGVDDRAGAIAEARRRGLL